MANKINNTQIVSSIEMKDKWLNSILKNSRKLTSLDKFWERILNELDLYNIKELNTKKVFISKEFLKKLKEADKNYNSEEYYKLYSPKTSSDIDKDDYTIYLLEDYIPSNRFF